MLAARFGLPDIGLVGLAEMAAGIRDIAAATPLPLFADGDDGYGDVKSVARMVEVYEDIGVGGILIEDQQRNCKQQGADRALGVVDRAVIEQKLRAALAARRSSNTLIIGRTDAYGFAGLEEALRRAERFVAIGVDGIFIAGVTSLDDYATIGRRLQGVTLSAALFEAPGMPWPTPAELGQMGFSHISYPASLMFRLVEVMGDTLSALRSHADGTKLMTQHHTAIAARAQLDDALELARWQSIDRDFAIMAGDQVRQQMNT